MPILPLRTKLLYGVGDAAINIKNTSLNQFLLFFYADVIRLAPELVGAALFIGKLWDGVTDPLLGYWSDTTRSRWGRRRPYVIGAALPVGLCYLLVFLPPEAGPFGLFAYLVATYVLLDTFFTAFATPYLAWGAELTDDYHDRTVVVQIRALFGVIGGIAGAALPIVIAQRFAEQRIGYGRMALVLGGLIAATALVTGLTVRDSPGENVPAASVGHFVRGLRGTFANRHFTIVFVTFCLMTVAAAVGQSVQLIVVKYRLQMYDFFPLIALTYALSFAASFPVWLALSRRVGKFRGLMLGLALSCIVPFGWVLVQPGQHVAMLAFSVAGGITTGSLTLALSQAIDVIAFDELLTGEKRAGAYFGIWTLGLKAMGALGTLLGGVLLSLVGYVPQEIQDPATLWWLVMLVGPLQAVVHLIGLIVFSRLRFTSEDAARVQAALAARQAAVVR